MYVSAQRFRGAVAARSTYRRKMIILKIWVLPCQCQRFVDPIEHQDKVDVNRHVRRIKLPNAIDFNFDKNDGCILLPVLKTVSVMEHIDIGPDNDK